MLEQDLGLDLHADAQEVTQHVNQEKQPMSQVSSHQLTPQGLPQLTQEVNSKYSLGPPQLMP